MRGGQRCWCPSCLRPHRSRSPREHACCLSPEGPFEFLGVGHMGTSCGVTSDGARNPASVKPGACPPPCLYQTSRIIVTHMRNLRGPHARARQGSIVASWDTAGLRQPALLCLSHMRWILTRTV